MKSLMTAIKFLTIIPIHSGPDLPDDIKKGVSAFPLVGLLQGAIAALTAYITGLYLPGGVSSAIVLIVLVVSSGGLHLDGLSDTFDAIAKRGDRDEKLRVMKDGSAGAIGVSAVFLALLLKYLCIESLRAPGHGAPGHGANGAFYALLFLMPVLSKWAMVASMFHGKPARREGLGALFIEGTTAKRALAATFYALLITFSISHFLIKDAGAAGPFFPALAMAVVYITGVLSARFFSGQFGGHTGDTLGATGEVSDIVFLLTALIWQKSSF